MLKYPYLYLQGYHTVHDYTIVYKAHCCCFIHDCIMNYLEIWRILEIAHSMKQHGRALRVLSYQRFNLCATLY